MINSSLDRSTLVAALRTAEHWDVIVIGGGATGLGSAIEAASRGYKTLLLEQDDFAKGTSSRSTKLIHGGVRYLAQGNLQLVRESLYERGLLRQNAPHLVQDLTFLVPLYAKWSKYYYGAGLKLYDWLAGKLNLGKSYFLNASETQSRMPTLNAQALQGSVVYHDAQFDDARLAIALLRTLFDQGGLALNYCSATGFIKRNDRIIGVWARDRETGESFELHAKVVINATGVFADVVRQLDQPTATRLLSPSQGIHLVVDRRFLKSESAMLIPKTEDGRVLFAVPWHDRIVIGTTDTPIDQIEIEPRPLEAEIDFILQTIAQYLTQAPTRQDVLSVFAGLRPLVKAAKRSTASLARDHVIQVSASGLLTITGGKWTTYRHMGESAIAKAIQLAELPNAPSITRTLPIHGWTDCSELEPFTVYGSDAALLKQLPGAETQLHPRFPYLEAQVRWAARYELARTVEDVLARRLRMLFLDAQASLEVAPRVAELLAEELGQNAAWQRQQMQHYGAIAAGYQVAEASEITWTKCVY